jgi:hypothetical protein
MPFRAGVLACATTLALAGAWPASAGAGYSKKKAIWGPVERGILSQFPVYRDLGVGIFQMELRWDQVALRRPRSPQNNHDRAYRWPPELDYAVGETRSRRVRIAVTVFGTPRWANGGRAPNWGPKGTRDFTNFLIAAAKRYPTIRLWRIWDEPSRQANWSPLIPQIQGQSLTERQKHAPRRYARLLDAAYGVLKKAARSNLVIGGNTATTGDISPMNWIQAMRLPNGRPPRMDLYGHNPFTTRRPNLGNPPLGGGNADFSDLDELAVVVDRHIGRDPVKRRRMRLFLAKFTIPTDHPERMFGGFYVDRAAQARWLADALAIIEPWPRIYAFGWFGLYDEPPTAARDETAGGLIDSRGAKKPSYFAYRDG